MEAVDFSPVTETKTFLYYGCACIFSFNTYLSLSCHSMSDLNLGRLVRGDLNIGFVPPAASAVLDLLEKHGELNRSPVNSGYSSRPQWCRLILNLFSLNLCLHGLACGCMLSPFVLFFSLQCVL